METERRITADPNYQIRNFRRCDVLDVWWPADFGRFVPRCAKLRNSEIVICSPFQLTDQTDLASIASRDINAEIGAFMTPK